MKFPEQNMNTIGNITTAVLALLFAATLLACGGKETSHAHEGDKEEWTCPMHPSVVSDRPGACPVCHMDLVKKAEVKEISAAEEAMLRSVTLSPAQRVLANIRTVAATRRDLARPLDVVGVVDFAEPLQAAVSARFRGRIEKLHVNFTGAIVRRGQTLFEMYSPELVTTQQDYLIALASRRDASTGGNDTPDRLLASIRDRLVLHYGLDAGNIDQLEKSGTVQHSVAIPSPISGTVTMKNVQEGRYVDEGTAVYEIADLSRVWVYVEVPEQDLRFVKAGQQATLRSAAWSDEEFRGRVTFIDPVMKQETRTVRVRVECSNSGNRLRPGMYVNGSISTQPRETLVVPVNAVIRTGRRDVLWVEAGENRFEPRTVRLGTRSGDWYEIVDGLEEGEMVAESGGYLLDSESTLLHPELASTAPSEASAQQVLGDKKRQTLGTANAPREIKITVNFGYTPEVVKVTAGETVRLLFHRTEDSKCTDEVVFPDFNIRKALPAFRSTAVLLQPKKKGTFTYSCGMDMLHGTLVVE
jgi:Cu(I)/Ag(I) efflux system membrane fusion protein